MTKVWGSGEWNREVDDAYLRRLAEQEAAREAVSARGVVYGLLAGVLLMVVVAFILTLIWVQP